MVRRGAQNESRATLEGNQVVRAIADCSGCICGSCARVSPSWGLEMVQVRTKENVGKACQNESGLWSEGRGGEGRVGENDRMRHRGMAFNRHVVRMHGIHSGTVVPGWVKGFKVSDSKQKVLGTGLSVMQGADCPPCPAGPLAKVISLWGEAPRPVGKKTSIKSSAQLVLRLYPP